MSNYPPGVSGMNPHIAGATDQFEDERMCSQCFALNTVIVTAYTNVWIWDCPNCNLENTEDDNWED
jgi:NMD protein affecting ribosome stability and mRNA decay